MISWIQKYFQQHFRAIFAILLALTIISFVFMTNASGGFGQSDRKVAQQPFFGHNLASESEMAAVQRATQLSSILHQENGNPLFRMSTLAVADQFHIPGPTEAELKDHLKTYALFAGEKGEFDPAAYNRFQSDIRKGGQFPESFVRRVIEDDFRIKRVLTLLGGPGYVQAQEIKSQLDRYDTSWTLGVATVDYKTFAPSITPTETDVAKFFSDNPSRYAIQQQISLRYADFAATSYLDKVNATEAELKAFYDANPARFAKPESKDAKTPLAPPSFESARLQVELAFKVEQAARLATKAASDFTLELYTKKIVPNTPAFDAFLASKKITLKELPPFSRENPPIELGSNADAIEEAFRLSSEQLYSDAIALSTGAAVLFWKDTIPVRQPELTEVKSKVTADYVEEEKRKRFIDLGKSLHAQIDARIKAGDTFEKAVASISGVSGAKIETKSYPAFTPRQRPQDLDYLVFSTLESLNKGDVSNMVASAEKGIIVYAADKKAPDCSEANPMYKTVHDQLARVTAMRNSAEYLRELADAELAKSAPAAQK